MIDLDKDIEDRAAYPLVEQRERWIFNKLTLAERLGYLCGPSGVDAPAGTYCIRPVMNVAGMGIGGVLKAKTDGRVEGLPYMPGYFWCQWFEGEHRWTIYTDDVPLDECYGDSSLGDRFDYEWRTSNFGAPPLPVFLQGISKHLMVETIGDHIIEISPRHVQYVNGRGTSYYQKIYPDLPWGFDDEKKEAFYWRVMQK